jgi:acetylglutamate kinase
VKQTLVFKVGGALLEDYSAAQTLLSAILEIQQFANLVLVHGGGNGVESLLRKLNLKSEKYNGLRVSPPEHMPFVTGALAGTANKQLCGIAYSLGIKNIGLSLFDGCSVSCTLTNTQLGCVGTPKANDGKLLKTLLANEYLPIISSIGCEDNGQLVNVNADQAATAIAQLLDADLYLLSDVAGVLDQDHHLVTELFDEKLDQLVKSQTIHSGMLVKVKAAKLAAESIQRRVFIGSWADIQALVNNINNSNQTRFGTRIMPSLKD